MKACKKEVEIDPSDTKRLLLKGSHIMLVKCPNCGGRNGNVSAFYSANARGGDDLLEYPSNGTHNANLWCSDCDYEKVVGTFEVKFQATFNFTPST